MLQRLDRAWFLGSVGGPNPWKGVGGHAAWAHGAGSSWAAKSGLGRRCQIDLFGLGGCSRIPGGKFLGGMHRYGAGAGGWELGVVSQICRVSHLLQKDPGQCRYT